MRKKVTRDVFMLAGTASLSLAMLVGSFLISRRLDLGMLGDGRLTQGSLEQLTGLVLGLLGAAILAWLLLGMLLALLATLSARLGHRRLGAKIGRLVPGFLARLGAAAIGGSLLLATSANAAAPQAATAQQLETPPTGQSTGQFTGQTASQPAPPDTGTTGDTTGDEATALSPGWLPQRISLPLQRLVGGATRTSQEVVVRPGDTLWSIAARHLAPEASAGEIAEAWPQWYAANRELIGPNPDRLVVGLALTEPETGITRP